MTSSYDKSPFLVLTLRSSTILCNISQVSENSFSERLWYMHRPFVYMWYIFIYFFDRHAKSFWITFILLSNYISSPVKLRGGIPIMRKILSGYLIIHPAKITFQKFQYGVDFFIVAIINLLFYSTFWGEYFLPKKFLCWWDIDVEKDIHCRLSTYGFL